MQIHAYLDFGGRCEEALQYYRETLGAEVTMMMRHGESPDPIPPEAVAETFWSPGFGRVADRFGVPWMINTFPDAPPRLEERASERVTGGSR